MPRSRTVFRVGSMTALLCVLTACGGGSKKTVITPTTSAGSSAVATTDSVAATTESQASSNASGGSCTPTAAVAAAATKFNEITKVTLAGGCGQVIAATTLAAGALGSPSVSRAITICTALTKVAYAGSVYGVSIEGKDGHELAASTKDQRQCI